MADTTFANEFSAAIAAGGDAPARIRSGIKRTMIGGRSVAGFMQSFPSPAYDGRTYQTILTSECPFIGYRVILRNNGPAYQLNACATSTDNGPKEFNPQPANWKQVTFGGQASPTVPAALGTNRPSILRSDIIWDTSVVRNDDPSLLPLLYVRTYYATGPAMGYGNTSKPVQGQNAWSPGGSNEYCKGRVVVISGAPGNFVSSNQAAFAAASPNDNFGMHVAEVEFITLRDVLTVDAMGDSITQGDTSTNNLLAPVLRAIALVSTFERPVFSANHGFSSQTTTNFVARLSDMIAGGYKPNVVVYSSYSPNDLQVGDLADMQQAVTKMRQNLYSALQLMRENNIYPIISTGLPFGYLAEVDAVRVAFNNEIRALGAKGVAVADYDALLTTGGTLPVIKFPQYAAGNQALHPNDGGYIAMGEQVLAPILQKLSDAYFTRAL